MGSVRGMMTVSSGMTVRSRMTRGGFAGMMCFDEAWMASLLDVLWPCRTA